MNAQNLQSLLIEYDQKRNRAIVEADQRKIELYAEIPGLEKIDNDINSISIRTIKSILTTQNSKAPQELQKELNILKGKKIEILKNAGKSLNDLSPHFECSNCNDTGYIKTSNGSVLCPCIKQRLYNIQYNNSNIYDLENQNFDKFTFDYYADTPDPDKYNSAISPRENMIKIKELCDKFIENFDNPEENNLLFCGSPGLGKTFLSSCIANEIIKKGKTVLYQTAPIMLDNIIDYKFGKTNNDIVKTISNVDLLIIDDLGTEAKNNLKITELFNILNSRLLNQNNRITKTIISTNLSLQELYSAYEERILSRIIGNYKACYFFGEDIRIKKKFANN